MVMLSSLSAAASQSWVAARVDVAAAVQPFGARAAGRVLGLRAQVSEDDEYLDDLEQRV